LAEKSSSVIALCFSDRVDVLEGEIEEEPEVEIDGATEEMVDEIEI
jgi:hypothetical protein